MAGAREGRSRGSSWWFSVQHGGRQVGGSERHGDGGGAVAVTGGGVLGGYGELPAAVVTGGGGGGGERFLGRRRAGAAAGHGDGRRRSGGGEGWGEEEGEAAEVRAGREPDPAAQRHADLRIGADAGRRRLARAVHAGVGRRRRHEARPGQPPPRLLLLHRCHGQALPPLPATAAAAADPAAVRLPLRLHR